MSNYVQVHQQPPLGDKNISYNVEEGISYV